MPINRKVAALSDAAYRLDDEAICWSSRNLTDGRIAADDFAGISKRATRKNAAELVRRQRWHTAEHECTSEHCPTPGPDGWVIHDYLDYNPSKEEVLAERAARAERTRRWRANKNGTGDGVGDASQDVPPTHHERGTRRVSDGVSDASPARPVPSRPVTEGASVAQPPTEPPLDEPPQRCPKHIEDPDPPPCGACADARRTAEAARTAALADAERQRRADAAARSQRARERAEADRAQIGACRLCDDRGRLAGGHVCLHDPQASGRAKRGAAVVRAALANPPSAPEREEAHA